MGNSSDISPFSLPNVQRFLAFRVLFNARFYYPVFTILFLDYGLSLEQFALLNTVWAVTIVLAEVPSGALADLLGRKRLLVGTSLLMVMEMSIIALVPLGKGTIIFLAFLLNRILSGLAEAMASGADEAMAYDTLVESGLEKEWPRVLDIQMRMQHVGYIFAMTIGAVVYDNATVNHALAWLGFTVSVTQQVSMRFPVYLTLVLGLLSLAVTMGMLDPQLEEAGGEKVLKEQPGGNGEKIREALHLTLQAGRWILRTPFALAVICFGMCFDHVLRMLVTMTSQYFRLIALPEASFGLIGSGIALLGLVIPRIARAMVHHLRPVHNVCVVGAIAFSALWGLTLFVPYVGIIPVVFIFIAMMMTSFFTSYYLNEIADSAHRATVLSFKGLAFNAAYGLIGLLYAGLMRGLRSSVGVAHPAWTTQMVENEAFRTSIGWFPWYLALALAVVTVFVFWRYSSAGKKKIARRSGSLPGR
ncbi:MAG TPA: MFS transporter [Desulfobulbus sp.]|nr:MFS transporter [Desulfobulbus sp.]